MYMFCCVGNFAGNYKMPNSQNPAFMRVLRQGVSDPGPDMAAHRATKH
jgi:hypothetical protein